MWPFGGATLVSLGLLPTAWHWLSRGQQQTSLWHVAATYASTDTAFVVGCLLFLYVAIKYGDTRCVLKSNTCCMHLCTAGAGAGAAAAAAATDGADVLSMHVCTPKFMMRIHTLSFQ
jgi:hypothetical protein